MGLSNIRLYLVATQHCNMHCKHCYLDAGPQQVSPSRKHITKMLDHFPLRLPTLQICGGEPLADRDYTNWLLGEIRQRRESGRLEVGRLELLTNGLIVHQSNKDNLTRLLADLADFGVTRLNIAGYSGFHLMQYFSAANIEDSSSMEIEKWQNVYRESVRGKLVSCGVRVRESFDSDDVLCTPPYYEGDSDGKLFGKGLTAMAIGHSSFRAFEAVPQKRGKSLPHWFHRTSCYLQQELSSIHEFSPFPEIYAEPNGDVEVCSFGRLKIGNLAQDPLEQIFDQSEQAYSAGEIIRFYKQIEQGEDMPAIPEVPCKLCKKG